MISSQEFSEEEQQIIYLLTQIDRFILLIDSSFSAILYHLDQTRQDIKHLIDKHVLMSHDSIINKLTYVKNILENIQTYNED